MSIELLITEILKDKPFFDSSGGGVTLSGGEPLMAMQFVSDLLTRLKAEGIHTLIETCGVFNFLQFKIGYRTFFSIGFALPDLMITRFLPLLFLKNLETRFIRN